MPTYKWALVCYTCAIFIPVKIRDQAYINAFGLHIKKLRMAKGLSQRDLAALADVSHQQIERVENGKVNVTLSTMLALAEALETTFHIGKEIKY